MNGFFSGALGETEPSNPPHPRKKIPPQTKITWNHKHVRVFISPPLKLFSFKTPLISAWESYHFNSPGWCSFSLYRDAGPESTHLTTLGGGTLVVRWDSPGRSGGFTTWRGIFLHESKELEMFLLEKIFEFFWFTLEDFERSKFDFAQMFFKVVCFFCM